MMAAPVVIIKAAIAVVTDKNLRKIVGGIVLGIIIVIVSPIAFILSLENSSGSVEWDSSLMEQHIMANMSEEERLKLKRFEEVFYAIEKEITRQDCSVEPIKAQVIFLCSFSVYEDSDTFFTDYVSCFEEDADDETVFENITEKFGVSFTAEEKEKILLLCDEAVAFQTE